MPNFLHGRNTRVILVNPDALGDLTTSLGIPQVSSANVDLTVLGTDAPVSTTISVVDTTNLFVGQYLRFTYTTNSNKWFSGTVTTVRPPLVGLPEVVLTVDTVNGTNTSTNSSWNVSQPNNVSDQTPTAYDLSQFFNNAGVSGSIEAVDTTTFQTGSAKSYIPGLRDGTITLSGYYDGTLTGVDAILKNAIGEANSGAPDNACVVFLAGGSNQNEICSVARGIETKYELKSPVTGVVTIDTEIQSDGGVWRGNGSVLTIITSGNSTPLDNGQPTYRGGLLVFGILNVTEGVVPNDLAISVEFQHSVDDTTWVTISESNLTNPSAEVNVFPLSTTSPLYRYTQLVWTLTGTTPSATLFYGFARF